MAAEDWQKALPATVCIAAPAMADPSVSRSIQCRLRLSGLVCSSTIVCCDCEAGRGRGAVSAARCRAEAIELRYMLSLIAPLQRFK